MGSGSPTAIPATPCRRREPLLIQASEPAGNHAYTIPAVTYASSTAGALSRQSDQKVRQVLAIEASPAAALRVQYNTPINSAPVRAPSPFVHAGGA